MGQRQHTGRTAEGADTEEGDNSTERLLLFTDAVAAIAITLLVLPLVDIVPEAVKEHAAAPDMITGHKAQIGSFLLSFLVIARLWVTHHRVIAGVVAHRRSLVAWLLAVVLPPFPTEMVGSYGEDRFVGVLYYLTVLAGIVCQAAMIAILRAHPSLVRGGPGRLPDQLFDTVANAVALLVALGVALAVPGLQYWSLLLLAAVPWTGRLRKWRATRSRAAV